MAVMEERFNPCFNGFFTLTSYSKLSVNSNTCFNPCFNGFFTLTPDQEKEVSEATAASILVLMDFSL